MPKQEECVAAAVALGHRRRDSTFRFEAYQDFKTLKAALGGTFETFQDDRTFKNTLGSAPPPWHFATAAARSLETLTG